MNAREAHEAMIAAQRAKMTPDGEDFIRQMDVAIDETALKGGWSVGAYYLEKMNAADASIAKSHFECKGFIVTPVYAGKQSGMEVSWKTNPMSPMKMLISGMDSLTAS